jgi:hypothetical protein
VRARLLLFLALAVLAIALSCRAHPRRDETAALRMRSLREANEKLHERLEAAVGSDPVTARAFADDGQLIVAVRSPLLSEVAARIAASYLDEVTLDLKDVEARAGGEIHKKILGARRKIGDWRVEVTLDQLEGVLHAGVPEIRPEGADRLRVRLPVDVRPARGKVSIRLLWDSAALANVVCKDFELARDLEGRVLKQRHVVEGAVQLGFEGDALQASPLFPDRKLRLRVDLTPESWRTVEDALRSQDTLGRCGLLMKPERGMERLHALADDGLEIKLPDELFRGLKLPARLAKAVTIADRPVELDARTRVLRFVPGMLWSSTAMHIRGASSEGGGTIYKEPASGPSSDPEHPIEAR